MEKTKLGTLKVDLINIKGVKDNKSYDFNKLELVIDNKTFDLYTKQEDKKLLDYLLTKIKA